jgi:putative phosphoesterase
MGGWSDYIIYAQDLSGLRDPKGLYSGRLGGMLSLGVIADTHVPDRRRSLDPRLLELLRSRDIQAILHAGDVSAPRVLRELERIAPVYAVRGNRDWLWLRHLPSERIMTFGGVTIAMAHGHFGWLRYLLDRPYYTLHGYRHERILPRLLRDFRQAQVIVFGHGHLPLNEWIDGRLLFNPGSPHFPSEKKVAPSLGFLHIQGGSEIRDENNVRDENKILGEIVTLD